jgi:DNA-binding NarL/FixJ family response regulator
VTTLGIPAAGHLLVVAPAPDNAARRVGALEAHAAADVLAQVVVGRSNKAVAATLACAESTIEIHVSALLEKAACDSRAQLVARFWSEP